MVWVGEMTSKTGMELIFEYAPLKKGERMVFGDEHEQGMYKITAVSNLKNKRGFKTIKLEVYHKNKKDSEVKKEIALDWRQVSAVESSVCRFSRCARFRSR